MSKNLNIFKRFFLICKLFKDPLEIEVDRLNREIERLNIEVERLNQLSIKLKIEQYRDVDEIIKNELYKCSG